MREGRRGRGRDNEGRREEDTDIDGIAVFS